MIEYIRNINNQDITCIDDENGMVLIKDEFCECCGIQIRLTEKIDYNNGRCEYCQD